jgi:hypothetical protein
MEFKKPAQQIAIVLFGIVFPIYVLFQAYQGITSLKDDVGYTTSVADLIKEFSDVGKNINGANDYALFSLMYVEHANQKTMINKQVMKAAIVHTGFAVISIGMMFIIIGINDGGIESSTGSGSLKFDFKTGSTGVGIFIIGALMATAGGVLKNDYSTSKIPMYGGDSNINYFTSLNAYKTCYAESAEHPEKCFASLFKQINERYLE